MEEVLLIAPKETKGTGKVINKELWENTMFLILMILSFKWILVSGFLFGKMGSVISMNASKQKVVT